jgi:hypothetical protein
MNLEECSVLCLRQVAPNGRLSRLVEAEPSRVSAGSMSGPELPPQLYSTHGELQAKPPQEKRLSALDMEHRPLPKVPEEAYNRLIQNQVGCCFYHCEIMPVFFFL